MPARTSRNSLTVASSARLLTISELAYRLRVSRSKIEQDVVDGLPHLDVGRHDPRRRPKRALRFEWAAVVAWYRR